MPKNSIDKELQKKKMENDVIDKKLNLEVLSSSEGHVENCDSKKIMTVKQEFPTELSDERTCLSTQKYGLRKRKMTIPLEQLKVKSIKQEFNPRKSTMKKEPNGEFLTTKNQENQHNRNIVKSENYTVNKERKMMKKPGAQAKKSNSKQQREKSLNLTNQKFVGAHVSISGGLENAVYNAKAIGARAFGLFLRSQRQWVCKPLSKETAEKFREACQEHDYPCHLILPHGSYLLNCGAPNEETLRKSREALIDELKRCEMLGIPMFNFHPGSTCGEISVESCLEKIAESINLAHSKTSSVITGFDLSQPKGFQKMMTEFENVIGLKYLKAIHLNDSAGKLGCHLDRHENIGKGNIGIEGFRHIMNDPRLNNIPMILETPANVSDEKEIQTLYELCNN
ncbi:putative endonuclease 4 isoform X2 [Tachypleus tridentatus]|uniref:putative endonuclease 4 isoform X2 n=1 Tax=Tachypleus tridentatus TaxID=6853 RepID=UPI003FD204D0